MRFEEGRKECISHPLRDEIPWPVRGGILQDLALTLRSYGYYGHWVTATDGRGEPNQTNLSTLRFSH